MQSYSIPGSVSGMWEPYEVDLYVNLEGEKILISFVLSSLCILFLFCLHYFFPQYFC